MKKLWKRVENNLFWGMPERSHGKTRHVLACPYGQSQRFPNQVDSGRKRQPRRRKRQPRHLPAGGRGNGGTFQQPEETTSVSEDFAAMEKILQDGPVANSDAEAELRALLAPDSSARQLVPVVDTMSESLSDWLGSALSGAVLADDGEPIATVEQLMIKASSKGHLAGLGVPTEHVDAVWARMEALEAGSPVSSNRDRVPALLRPDTDASALLCSDGHRLSRRLRT